MNRLDYQRKCNRILDMSKQPRDKVLTTHTFVFNDRDNSGEGLSIDTSFLDNGDDKDNIYLNQRITLQSYCNSASFDLFGACLTSEKLRKLADELDSQKAKLTR